MERSPIILQLDWKLLSNTRHHQSDKVADYRMEKIVVGYLYSVSRCIVVISVIKKMNGQYLSRRYRQDIKEEKKTLGRRQAESQEKM